MPFIVQNLSNEYGISYTFGDVWYPQLRDIKLPSAFAKSGLDSFGVNNIDLCVASLPFHRGDSGVTNSNL